MKVFQPKNIQVINQNELIENKISPSTLNTPAIIDIASKDSINYDYKSSQNNDDQKTQVTNKMHDAIKNLIVQNSDIANMFELV